MSSTTCGASSKCNKLFATPLEAFANGPREGLLYVTCTRYKPELPDYLATVDVDPNSPTYCQVIHRLIMPHVGDELHHSGWNACCSSGDKASRSHLVLAGLNSSRIYFVDVTGKHTRQPAISKTIEPNDLYRLNVSAPHTIHCIAGGDIMISTMGNEHGEPKGNFILIDGKTFSVKEKWNDHETEFGYDFWYQPRINAMISSEWGSPNCFRKGLDLADVTNGKYGHAIHVWDWHDRKHKQRIELNADAAMPLEVRFLHEPSKAHGFVGIALGSSLYHFHRDEEGWKADKVHQVEPLAVEGWILPNMPAVITDILISLDDKFLYASCWLHGRLIQYDISDPFKPKIASELQIGGIPNKESGVTVVGEAPRENFVVKGCVVHGGPQMMQLSLDGKRLYVTTSLFSSWDHQFYPDLPRKGGVMLRVDVDTVNGGMKLNQDFLVDFGAEPDGPVLAHEMRYPGGDCSSDIWL